MFFLIDADIKWAIGEVVVDKDSNIVKLLRRGDIHPLSKVIIYRKHNGVEYPTELDNVLDYEISSDRQFGASSLSFNTTNPNGEFSYRNTMSRRNYLYANKSEVLELDLGEATLVNCEIESGEIVLTNKEEMGEATFFLDADIINNTAWHYISWNIKPNTHERAMTYHGVVDIYVRFLNSEGVETSPWQKIQTVREGQVDFRRRNLFNTSKKMEVNLKIYPAATFKSPQIKGIEVGYLKGDRDEVFSPLVYYGNRIVVYEGVTDSENSTVEWLRKFKGYIEEVIPVHSETGLTLRCSALDEMRICLNDFYEKPDPYDENDTLFSPAVRGVENDARFAFVKKTLRALSSDPSEQKPVDREEVPVMPGEERRVFRIPLEHIGSDADIDFMRNGPIRGYPEHLNDDDFPETTPKHNQLGDYKYLPWVERPNPIITVGGEDRPDGYQIDFQRGVVYFPEKIDEEDDVEISFAHYDLSTNLFEDVVGKILASAVENFYKKEPVILWQNQDCVLLGVQAGTDSTEVKNIQMPDDGYGSFQGDVAGDVPLILLEKSLPRTTIPPTGFYLKDSKSFFDAVNDICDHVSPDYVIRATTEGNFIGEYLPQQEKANFTLNLIEQMDAPVSEEEIFTKCIAQGINPVMANIAPDAEITVNEGGDECNIYHTSNTDVQYSKENIVDGNLTTNFGFSFDERPPMPRTMFTFNFDESFVLGAVNILIGDGQGAPSHSRGVGELNINGIGFIVEASADKQVWLPITENSHVGASGQWVRIEKNGMYDDIGVMKIKHLRIRATAMPMYERGKGPWFFGWFESITKVWNWAIRQVQIFADETIREEVSISDLADSPIFKNNPEYQKVLQELARDMSERIGSKTVILPVEATLRTEYMVRARALDYLYECARNLYTSEVRVVYAPHVNVGDTVEVSNEYILEPNKSTNYYVDGIRREMNSEEPSTILSLISWV